MNFFDIDVPEVDDVIGIAKINLEIKGKTQDRTITYHTPPLHFMIYKIKSIYDEKISFECANLEFGRFHVVAGLKNEKQELIRKLVLESLDLVAEYIAVNVFDNDYNVLIEGLKTNFMDEFWKVYRIFKMLHSSVVEEETDVQADKAVQTLIASLNDKEKNNNPKNRTPTEILLPRAS